MIFKEIFNQRPDAVTDPWGAGMTFYVRPANHPRVVAAMPADDRYTRGLNEVVKRRIRKMVEESKDFSLDMLGSGAGIDLEGLEREAALAVLSSDEPVTSRASLESPEVTAARLANWKGVNDAAGEPIPFSAEAAAELLALDDVVPANQPGQSTDRWARRSRRSSSPSRPRQP